MMAKEQGGAARGSDRDQQQDARAREAGAASGGAGSQGAGAVSDRERQREVARERGTMARRGRGALARRAEGQLPYFPPFIGHPGFLANAFMSDPFGFARAMGQEMDRFLSSWGDVAPTFGGGRERSGLDLLPWRRAGGQGLAQWVPPVDVVQRGNELVVRADLPGLDPEDVSIEVEDGMLTISGERREESEEQEEGGWYRSERRYGSFTRSIALPEGVDEERVQARFDNGVLEVTAPIPEQRQRGRRIQIQSGAGGRTPEAKGGGRQARG